MKASRLRIEELRTFHTNPRRGNVDVIARSLRKNGQYRPIVVNEGSMTGRPLEVLAGNHTLMAARELGWDEVDVVLVDVDEESASRIVLADNRTADLGGYDGKILEELLASLPDLTGTGYDADQRRTPPKPALNLLRIGSVKITLGPEEEKLLRDLIDRYIDDRGVMTGFVGWLADGGETVAEVPA